MAEFDQIYPVEAEERDVDDNCNVVISAISWIYIRLYRFSDVPQ